MGYLFMVWCKLHPIPEGIGCGHHRSIMGTMMMWDSRLQDQASTCIMK